MVSASKSPVDAGKSPVDAGKPPVDAAGGFEDAAGGFRRCWEASRGCRGRLRRCCGRLRRCWEASRRCCGRLRRCCGRLRRCCGRLRRCWEASRRCRGRLRRCCGRLRRCWEASRRWCGRLRRCCGRLRRCWEASRRWCGRLRRCCGRLRGRRHGNSWPRRASAITWRRSTGTRRCCRSCGACCSSSSVRHVPAANSMGVITRWVRPLRGTFSNYATLPSRSPEIRSSANGGRAQERTSRSRPAASPAAMRRAQWASECRWSRRSVESGGVLPGRAVGARSGRPSARAIVRIASRVASWAGAEVTVRWSQRRSSPSQERAARIVEAHRLGDPG